MNIDYHISLFCQAKRDITKNIFLCNVSFPFLFHVLPESGKSHAENKKQTANTNKIIRSAPLLHQPPALRTQPSAPFLIVRQDFFHFLPEQHRVVHLLPMAQFMYHYVIKHFRWRKDQPEIIIKISGAAAAAPSRFLVTNRNFSIAYAKDPRKKRSPLCKTIPCLFSTGLQLRLCRTGKKVVLLRPASAASPGAA